MTSVPFSYAQAAKGQAVAQASPQQIPSSPPSISSQAKDDIPTGNTSVTAPSIASNDAESRDVGKNGNSDVEPVLSRQDSEVVYVGESAAPSTVSAAEQSIKSSRDGDVTTVDSQLQQDDKASRSASRTSRSNDGPEARKGRKAKKGRGNDKETQVDQQQEEEKEKVVLSEAPVPTVNIWKQRQEDRAKYVPASAGAGLSTNGNDAKKSATQEEGDAQSPTTNGAAKEKSQKKVSEQPRSSRSGPRGTRGNDKDEKPSGSLPPPVEDTSAWPDPKSAASTDAAAPKAQGKAVLVEREGREDARQPQTKWTKMDIQPNVVFNTQLPKQGGPRPRGGARGGREAGPSRDNQANVANATSTGTQTAFNEKAPTTNGNGAPKGTASHPRENNLPVRAASQPIPLTAAKRAAGDGAVPKDQRKLSASAQGESGREAVLENAAPGKKGTSQRAPPGDIRQMNIETASTSARPAAQDRPKATEPIKDGANATSNQQYGAREGRGERRGGYRGGRAGHNGAPSQHAQQGTYAPNGQYNMQPYQQRQSPVGPSPPHSGQFSGYGQQPRGRAGHGNWRGQGSGRSNSNGAAYAARPSPQIGELPVPQYHAPYPYVLPAFDPMLPMVKSQVEYYLSVENLCKDFFLRKHMDCQGYVKLQVIAGFKRMQDLTNNSAPDLLRTACSLSDSIELVYGDDQVERVRNRDKWSSFVLPAKDRIEGLQNDTAINYTPYPTQPAYPTPMHQQYAVTSPIGMYPPFPFPEDQGQGYQTGYMNGAHYEQPGVNGTGPNGHHYGHGPETQLSAVVPDFLPTVAPAAPPFTLASLNNLPDSKVDNVIVLERPGSDSADAGAAGYISNNLHYQDMNGAPPADTEPPRYAGPSPPLPVKMD